MKLIEMASIGAAHGIRGEVKLRVWAADPMTLPDQHLETSAGRVIRIEKIRAAGDTLIARISGIDTREAAEALTGTVLYADRATLPSPGEDEFYHADLVGLEVRHQGVAMGKVVAVHNFGAGDILEVTWQGKQVMIPFSRAAVPEIDIAGGWIAADPEKAGL